MRFTTATAFRLKPEATQGEPESEQDGDVDDDVGAPVVNHRLAVEDAAAVFRRQPPETAFEGIREWLVLLLPARRERAAARHLLAQAGRKVPVSRRVVLANDPDVTGGENHVDGDARIRNGDRLLLAVPLVLAPCPCPARPRPLSGSAALPGQCTSVVSWSVVPLSWRGKAVATSLARARRSKRRPRQVFWPNRQDASAVQPTNLAQRSSRW